MLLPRPQNLRARCWQMNEPTLLPAAYPLRRINAGQGL